MASIYKGEVRAKCEKKDHSVIGGLKMGVSVAAHTHHIILGTAPLGLALQLPWVKTVYLWIVPA